VAEFLFYHLTQAPLSRALPEVLSRSLQRGWLPSRRLPEAPIWDCGPLASLRGPW
jgi:hypothetical protein